jgi:hypothetical protein
MPYRYWTSDPFEAMSLASKLGRDVDLYPSGQYIPGMFSLYSRFWLSTTFYGYGVKDPKGGFTWLFFK